MKKAFFKFIRVAFVLAAVFIIMFILILIPNGDTDNTSYNYQSNDCYETQAVNIYERITTRSWQDYFSSGYCMEYTSELDEYIVAKEEREQFDGYNDGVDYKFWGRLYAELYNQNKDKLGHIADYLWSIKVQKDLNRFDFANMVTCFVQDIPYVYVLPNGIPCEDQDDPSSDCLENVKYGILSPIEFLHTLKGDCDTRTVLLYTLFKHFNYSPKIAVSEFYAHSVLLLDIPANGDYVTIDRNRYYFWETTATGWQAGILPPSCNDISKWDIALF